MLHENVYNLDILSLEKKINFFTFFFFSQQVRFLWLCVQIRKLIIFVSELEVVFLIVKLINELVYIGSFQYRLILILRNWQNLVDFIVGLLWITLLFNMLFLSFISLMLFSRRWASMSYVCMSICTRVWFSSHTIFWTICAEFSEINGNVPNLYNPIFQSTIQSHITKISIFQLT